MIKGSTSLTTIMLQTGVEHQTTTLGTDAGKCGGAFQGSNARGRKDTPEGWQVCPSCLGGTGRAGAAAIGWRLNPTGTQALTVSRSVMSNGEVAETAKAAALT